MIGIRSQQTTTKISAAILSDSLDGGRTRRLPEPDISLGGIYFGSASTMSIEPVWQTDSIKAIGKKRTRTRA